MQHSKHKLCTHGYHYRRTYIRVKINISVNIYVHAQINIQTAQDPLKAFTHSYTHVYTLTKLQLHMYRHVSTRICTLAHKSRGTWLETQHLDRLLTTDATSRQHKTLSKLSLTATYTCTHSQNCTCILTHKSWGTWLETQHLDRLLTTDATSRRRAKLSLTAIYTCIHSQNCTCILTHKSRGTWLETQHLDRLLTTDATSRQHKTLSKLSLTAIYTCIHSQNCTCILTHKSWGTWLETQHLDRLLTTDATSRQHKTLSKLSLTAIYTCTHSQNCTYTCTDMYQQVHSLTNLGVPDLRRNISTGCWQRTQHPDSTRPSQSFHSQPHTHVHTHKIALTHVQTCIKMYTRSQISGYLTWDATSRQAADNGRNIQTAQDPLKAFTHSYIHMYTLKKLHLHMYRHVSKCTLAHKSRGTWLETQHLDRLLTTDATSRQHKTLSKLSLTALYMYTCTHSQKIIAVTHVHSITKLGVPDLKTNFKFAHRYTYCLTHDFIAESTVTCTLKTHPSV